MSKNQGGIVQYVDFHQDINVEIISEQKLKSKKIEKRTVKSKIAKAIVETKPTDNKVETGVQQPANLVQFVKKTEKSPAQKVKIQVENKEIQKKEIPVVNAEKKTTKKSAIKKVDLEIIEKKPEEKKVKSKAKVVKKSIVKTPRGKKIQEKSEAKSNVIHLFFERNKSFYDIQGILSSDKASKIVLLKDETNEKIHKKAVSAIIKSIKSKRKFKFEMVS